MLTKDLQILSGFFVKNIFLHICLYYVSNWSLFEYCQQFQQNLKYSSKHVGNNFKYICILSKKSVIAFKHIESTDFQRSAFTNAFVAKCTRKCENEFPYNKGLFETDMNYDNIAAKLEGTMTTR